MATSIQRALKVATILPSNSQMVWGNQADCKTVKSTSYREQTESTSLSWIAWLFKVIEKQLQSKTNKFWIMKAQKIHAKTVAMVKFKRTIRFRSVSNDSKWANSRDRSADAFNAAKGSANGQMGSLGACKSDFEWFIMIVSQFRSLPFRQRNESFNAKFEIMIIAIRSRNSKTEKKKHLVSLRMSSSENFVSQSDKLLW